MEPNELSVLLADDDDDARGALAELLARRGVVTAQAADGQDALDRLAGGEPPCVILLDWVMPRVDGEAFLQARAASPVLSTIPVIVVSATHAAAEDPRVAAFVQKPVPVDQLAAVVRRTCHAACPAWLRARRGCAQPCAAPPELPLSPPPPTRPPRTA